MQKMAQKRPQSLCQVHAQQSNADDTERSFPQVRHDAVEPIVSMLFWLQSGLYISESSAIRCSLWAGRTTFYPKFHKFYRRKFYIIVSS